MRTLLTDWLKLSVALMTVVALTSVTSADDKKDDQKKESPRAKLVKERRLNTIAKTKAPVEGFKSVDLFDAMDHGEIDVVFRARDAANANLIIENKSDKPLAIKMPAAFSAVPVMRQGLGGFGGGQQGGGGGVFNIPPGRVGKASLKTVCLEEGKPDPKSRIEYKIQPLEKLNSDPKIFEMLQMLANDEIAQPAVQAAAWNTTDGLSWQQLLVKNRIERMDGSYERYFHPNHLRIAQQVVTVSEQRAELRAQWKKQMEKQKTKPSDEYQTTSVDDDAN